MNRPFIQGSCDAQFSPLVQTTSGRVYFAMQGKKVIIAGHVGREDVLNIYELLIKYKLNMCGRNENQFDTEAENLDKLSLVNGQLLNVPKCKANVVS